MLESKSGTATSVWDGVLDAPKLDHRVQFYGSNEALLVRNVTNYLSEGLNNGEVALVIATPEHVRAFSHGLEPYPAAGRLVCLDAASTLARFMVSGIPVWDLFAEAIASVVRNIRERASGLRAYGEMVALLWNAGERAAAVRVEQFWNRLLSRLSFNLFCGYPIDIFDPAFDPKSIDALLSTHTHVLPGDCQELETAILRSMKEVLGAQAENAETAMKQQPSSARWGILPRSEALILWLRRNAPDQAAEILRRARAHSSHPPAATTHKPRA